MALAVPTSSIIVFWPTQWSPACTQDSEEDAVDPKLEEPSSFRQGWGYRSGIRYGFPHKSVHRYVCMHASMPACMYEVIKLDQGSAAT